MRGRAALLGAAIILAPLGAKAADLVVWWEEGYYAAEDAATSETIEAFERDTGSTPPNSVHWSKRDSNEEFLAQNVVMTTNKTFSSTNALNSERSADHHDSTATIEWPRSAQSEASPIFGTVFSGVVFKDGGNAVTVKEFVPFLLVEGWLAHSLNFSDERFRPPLSKLLEQPFRLDPGGRDQMAAVMQASSRPLAYEYARASGNRRSDLVWQEWPWAKAIRSVMTGGISPEQAVDEAIARIEESLVE